MAISYSGEGYKFTPQFANLGALQGLQPLDVTRRAQFETRPLTYAEIPSSRPELVAEGVSKGILAAVGGITEGITAKYKSDQAKEEKAIERAHEIDVANIKASGYDDTLTRQKALYDYKTDQETKKRLQGSLGENYPIYGTDAETKTEVEPTPIEEPLPDFEEPLSETSVDGTSLFSGLTPAEQMQGQIAEQAKQLEGLSPEYLTAGTEGGLVAPIAPTPIMSIGGLKATVISPEQAQKTLETRKELRKTLAGIEAPKSVKEQPQKPQQPGWRPIAQAEAEAGREIPGWQKAEIDPKNVQMIGGVPHFLVLPRKPKSQKELKDEEKAQAEAKAAAETPLLSKDQIGVYDKLAGNVQQNPLIKNAIDAKSSQSIIHSSLAENNGFGDITAINAFQRMVDPGVAVREGDVTLLQSAIPRLRRLGLTVENLVEGDKLTPEARQQLKTLSFRLAKTRAELAKDSINDLRLTAQDAGINPDRVVREISFEEPKEQVQQNQKQKIESELNSMQKGTSEYQKKYRELVDIIKAEKTASKSTPQATVQPSQQPIFQPAIPRQPAQYGETLESFLGNK